MKGVEIGKETVNDDSSKVNLLREATMKEPYVLIKDKINIGSYGSSNSTIPPNSSFNYKSEVFDITDSDTGDTINLVSGAFPQYSVSKTLKRTKRRGWPKGKPRKSYVRANTRPQRGNEHSMPYTNAFLGQQSYTQVSVEEVHLAQPKKTKGRPHKNISNKPSGEMFILKKIQKKIVHNSGFEYPPARIPKHYQSNVNEGNSFNDSSQSNQTAKSTVKKSDKQLVKYTPGSSPKRRASRLPNEQEKYGPDLLPPGWDTNVVTRKTGKTAGNIDVYFVTPEGKRIRSKQELAAYIVRNNLPLSPDEFIFRKSAYANRLPMIECSKELPMIEYRKDSS